MRDKRPVDELSIEELERILAIRKRAARQERLRHLEGRRLPTAAPIDAAAPEPVIVPQQHEAAENLPPLEPPVTYDLTDDLPRFEDELDEETEARSQKVARRAPGSNGARGAPRRGAWDKALLLVEISAVIALVMLFGVGVYLVIDENRKLDELDEKKAALQPPPAPTNTPAPELRIQLSDYVLPGGHYSPLDAGGNSGFNIEELPPSIRPAVMAQLLEGPQAPIEPIRGVSPINIEIPKIGVDASIFEGDDWFTLQKGVGHYPNSANPGENGNMVLTAHNDIYGAIFARIHELQPGDEIRVQADSGQWYTYIVEGRDFVDPTATYVLERGNQPIVSLITCYPTPINNKRIVVRARLSP